jgi:hypothetical protein
VWTRLAGKGLPDLRIDYFKSMAMIAGPPGPAGV